MQNRLPRGRVRRDDVLSPRQCFARSEDNLNEVDVHHLGERERLLKPAEVKERAGYDFLRRLRKNVEKRGQLLLLARPV